MFSPNQPLGRFGLVVAMSVCVFLTLFVYDFVPFPCNFFQGLSLALRSHDQILASHWSILIMYPWWELWRPCNGLLDENAEEVQSLHHTLQSHDCLLDENAEEVHNLQSHDLERFCVSRMRDFLIHISRFIWPCKSWTDARFFHFTICDAKYTCSKTFWSLE